MNFVIKFCNFIVCELNAGDQVKGRRINTDSSMKMSNEKQAEMDKLIDIEIENAYAYAKQIINENKDL